MVKFGIAVVLVVFKNIIYEPTMKIQYGGFFPR